MDEHEKSGEINLHEKFCQQPIPQAIASEKPVRMALIYAFFGVTWIILTDAATKWIMPASEGMITVQLLKGLAFVAVSSLVVYQLAYRAKKNTERDMKQRQMADREKIFRATVNSMGEAVLVINPEDRTIMECNPATERIFGYSRSELIGQSTEILHLSSESFALWAEKSESALEEEGVYESEYPMQHKDGSKIDTEITVSAIDESIGWQNGVISVVRDVTDRAEARRELAAAKAEMEQTLAVLPSLVYSVTYPTENEGTGTKTVRNGKVNYLNAESSVYGYPAKDFDTQLWMNNVHPDDYDRIVESMTSLLKESTEFDRQYRFRNANGDYNWIRDKGGVIEAPGGKKVIGVWADITEQKKATDEIERRCNHLSGLRKIEQAISSSFNLDLTLKVLCAETSKILDADAVDILRLNEGDNMLRCVHEEGFHTDLIRDTAINPGEGYAGRVASEQKVLGCEDLQNASPPFLREKLIQQEDFVTYHGVPLMAKGNLKGVAEVFHREKQSVDKQWFDFLESLAGQAGIAIDNNEMFTNLQSRNRELQNAYDKTIQGWGRALDLRDEETVGHSERVTKMAVKLARKCGITGAELKNLRWGAYLHDIGKIGVPDDILRKPGSLTSEEQQRMQRHPNYAYKMLAPIEHLKPAIDIPYCHHERWDGSGYPRGLQGEEIPIAARVFACVDVWDALRSDRPYREALPPDEVREYMRSQAGVYFDPSILHTFLNMDLETIEHDL